MGRDKGDLTKGIPGTPALLRQGGRGDNAFVYKTCQGKYDMNSTWYDESSSRYDPLVASTCPGPNQALGNDTLSKGHAYWINNGSCTQSFGNPRFYVHNPSTTNDGFNLVFTSQQPCAANSSKNFEMTIKGTCEKDESNAIPMSMSSVSYDCKATATFSGPEACKFDLGVVQIIIDFIWKFSGFFLIAFGVVMCFYGSKFLFFMIAAMIFMGTFGFLFLLYQVNAATDASATQVYVMLFVCLAISGLASYCLHKFIKASTVPILGGFAGVAVCQTIVKTFQIK
jgi:hypothetical protein